MAPTICVAEFPMAGTAVSTLAPRQQGPDDDTTWRIFALQELLRTGTIVEAYLPPDEHCSQRLACADTAPNCSVAEADGSGERTAYADEGYRKDLLSIVIRTVTLVRRNRILQRQLDALQAETRRYLSSALNNPEGQQRRTQAEDPSSAEGAVPALSPPRDPASARNWSRVVTFGRSDCDSTEDESSLSDKSEDSDWGEC
ncbi:PREDICTED: uncharacterized protein LOC105561595 [Vollenhovia emeryi]|uniref:uncharacterized protein LOC105561595 n=1 Tax=Vollenhovia emeryi TaxID=411798 RepID=UPI0005F3C827|nr:PREDICTED: uncharacterized protein LOC105561595 [Vollenhovia emeryi]XP_011867090.1 PREDICTED: uncharacterized protein LOC105561595 [Vollenhovia emeryi]XP_011867091.1 PREDICTED: uncharacterized protein LOC105561595 [Vollenhovia emeryi]